VGKLTNLNHERFAQEYAKRRNSAAAAKAAGSQANDLAVAGYEILHRPEVRKRITELSTRLLEVADMSANRLVLEIGRTAHIDHRRFSIEDTYPPGHPQAGQTYMRQKRVDELDDDEGAAIKGYDRNGNYTFWDKGVAQGILAKHFKVINDEGDGVSALANALASRLSTARKRTEPEPTPRPVVDTSIGEEEDLA
jgi:phage terminase small subunit